MDNRQTLRKDIQSQMGSGVRGKEEWAGNPCLTGIGFQAIRPAVLCSLLLALVVAAALLMMTWSGMRVRAQAGADIELRVPPPGEVMVDGNIVTTTVIITASELYGYQFIVTFDPGLLEAVSTGFYSGFLRAEYSPPAWSGVIDNVAGTVRFAATQVRPTPPVSGSGAVAWIAFRAKWVSGLPLPTMIHFSEVRLATVDGMTLEPVTVHPGFVTIVPFSALEVRVPAPGQILEDNGAITTTLVLTCENVYGYQFMVTFDPTLLQVDGAGFNDSFIKPDYTPPLWSATIDNGAGTVRFAASQMRPALPVTGTGVIGWVRFIGQSPPTLPATATVGIREPRLATRDGVPMTPIVISGTIGILPKAVITGQVELQGRTNWSGAVAMAVPAMVTCTTDATGWYTLTVAAGTYTVTIEMARYLDAERVVTATRGANPLPRVKLLGGDANDDDEVDILDASIIGGKYGLIVDPLTERADINADGVVDISDCAITGGNYTRVSPVPWP
jgi:hypothetical protein